MSLISSTHWLVLWSLFSPSTTHTSTDPIRSLQLISIFCITACQLLIDGSNGIQRTQFPRQFVRLVFSRVFCTRSLLMHTVMRIRSTHIFFYPSQTIDVLPVVYGAAIWFRKQLIGSRSRSLPSVSLNYIFCSCFEIKFSVSLASGVHRPE